MGRAELELESYWEMVETVIDWEGGVDADDDMEEVGVPNKRAGDAVATAAKVARFRARDETGESTGAGRWQGSEWSDGSDGSEWGVKRGQCRGLWRGDGEGESGDEEWMPWGA